MIVLSLKIKTRPFLMRSLMEKSLNLDYLCQIKHKVIKKKNKICQFSLNDCWSKVLWHRFYIFYPTASATAYGPRPKFVRAEHSATAEGEKFGYGPTL